MTFFLCAGLVFSFPAQEAYAKPKKKKKGEVEQVDSVKKKETDYDKLMKEKPVTSKGFITLHQSKAKLYFEIPENMLGRDMLLGSIVSEISNNYNATAGTQPFDPIHIKFEKQGKNVNMVKIVKDYVSDDPALLESIDKNSSGVIIKSFKIHSYNTDSTAVVFDATDFFVGDQKDMGPFSPYGLYKMYGAKGTPIYQSDKSFLDECKAFEQNITIKSYLTYKYSLTLKNMTIVEDELLTARMTRSLILLDSIPYRPRRVDSRMAMFPIGKMRFNGDKQGSEIIYYVNRWRLEPSDPEAFAAGKLSDPKKPIVYYIDPAFPAEWKDAIYEAVNMWQEPFEKIGFSNAIVAKDYPTDDPAFDPDNIRYSCVRYNPLGFENAMGPSWTDPRSGEIINASVYVYHDVIKLINNWRYIQTAQADESVRSGKLPKDVLDDAIRYVIGHEVGHTLGLMHNMSASAVIPVDSLRSPSFTGKYGTTTSIMDYARFNYVAQPGDKERGVKLTPPKFGVYDYFSIRWAYTPVDESLSVDEEYAITSRWLSEAAADPVYRYGKQQFQATIDPRSQSEDLGDDAMKASAYGISNLKYILSNLNSWVKDDFDFQYRTEIYTGIVYQYVNYISHVFANVGGIYLNEKMAGDPVEAYRCVPKEKQKEAFDFICKEISQLDWLDNKELLKNIPFMGSPKEAIENALIPAIIYAPFKVAQPSMMGEPGEVYTTEECLKNVYDFVWKPTIQGKRLTALDMKLQREFMVAICGGTGLKYEGTGANPQSLADIHIEMPELAKDYAAKMKSICYKDDCCAHNHDMSPVSGYDAPYYHFIAPVMNSQEFYPYIQKVQKLIRSRVASSTGEQKAHYELMLRNIEKTLK